MDRYEFLSRVLPELGNGTYIATLKSARGMFWNKAFDTQQELADFCHTESNRGNTAYFALGTFQDNIIDGKISRKAIYATTFKTVAIDIDCGAGKPYKNQSEGYAALKVFITKLGLPHPLILNSGNGLHCHWYLTRAISANEWLAITTPLHAILKADEFKVDLSKVCDG